MDKPFEGDYTADVTIDIGIGIEVSKEYGKYELNDKNAGGYEGDN